MGSSALARMLVAAVGITAALAITGISLATTGTPAQALQPEAQLDVLVKHDGRVGPRNIAAFTEANEAMNVTHEFRHIDWLLVSTTDGSSFEELQRDLLKVPGVLLLELDEEVAPTLDDSLPHIGADAVHTNGFLGSGQTIAILDTGIDRDHPFFAGRVVAEACFSSESTFGSTKVSLCPDGSTEQTGTGASDSQIPICFDGSDHLCDHGPHVAGIAAGGAGVTGSPGPGVAPGADIVSVQVFHRRNSNTLGFGCDDGTPCPLSRTSSQLKGLEYVIDLVDDGEPVTAVNMSLGGGENDEHCDTIFGITVSRYDAFDQLRTRGVVPVVAAGNDGYGSAVSTPSCLSNAVAVGNTLAVADPTEGLDVDDLHPSSNRGRLLDLLAPGFAIESAIGNNDYGDKTGTSMSAPHVAGAIAVLAEAWPGASVSQLIDLLTDTGVPITYPSVSGDFVSDVTTPRLDLQAALGAVAGDPPQLTVDDAQVKADEGELVANSGTVVAPAGFVSVSASVGEVFRMGGGWTWSYRPVDGPRDTQPVTITAVDSIGRSEEVTFDLDVDNVAPSLGFDPDQTFRPFPEQDLDVEVTFTDPGARDAPFVAQVDCDTGPPSVSSTGFQRDEQVLARPGGGERLVGTHRFTCRYSQTEPGDAPFNLRYALRDRDLGSTTIERQVEWFSFRDHLVYGNFTLADGIRTDWSEIQLLLDEVDQVMTFDATAFGPIDLDAELVWDLGDGTRIRQPAPRTGPSVTLPGQPDDARGIPAAVDHTYRQPGLYDIELQLELADGDVFGPATQTVVATGNDAAPSSPRRWASRADDPSLVGVVSPVQLASSGRFERYLDIVEQLSPTFAAGRGLSRQAALGTLRDTGSVSAAFDAELLAGWLNVAAGGLDLDEAVPFTDGDLTVRDLLVDADRKRQRNSASLAERRALTRWLRVTNRGASTMSGFLDVSAGDTHAAAIDWLFVTGITTGIDDDTYGQVLPVTRGQMASFLDRALRLPDTSPIGFPDVDPDNVHAQAIDRLAAAGITEGRDDGTYGSELPVTRAQMASFLDRALDLPDALPAGFDDVPAGSVHAGAIDRLLDAGITQGIDIGRYGPNLPITRAQMATFLFRALAE